jgi:hypothetical protein
MDDKTKLLGCIIGFLALPFLMALKAVVVRDLWLWFVVPLGVAALSFWHAMGLSSLVALLTHQIAKSEFEDEEHGWAFRLVTLVIAYLFAWGLGWLIHSFM